MPLLSLLVPGVGMRGGGAVVPPPSPFPYFIKRMKGTPMSRTGMFGIRTILITSTDDELTYNVQPNERP